MKTHSEIISDLEFLLDDLELMTNNVETMIKGLKQ